MSNLGPSKTNKLLAKLFCASLWRKGALCCTMNCSCFNDVENPEAERHRAQEARWKYKSEKLAAQKESKEKAAERREARKEKAQNVKEAKRTAAIEKSNQSKQEKSEIAAKSSEVGTEQDREISSGISAGSDAQPPNEITEDNCASGASTPDGKRHGKSSRRKRKAQAAAAKREARSNRGKSSTKIQAQ